jgi:enoyl-CoA hydratase/carnithine racemase
MTLLIVRSSLLATISPKRLGCYCRSSLPCLSRRQWRSNTVDRQVLLETLAPQGFPDRLVAKVTLNRPKANAMGSVMVQELQDCLDILEETNSKAIRCVVVTSSLGKVFSAGADLKERATMTQDQAADFVTLLRNTMERVACLAVPVLAAVEGVAVGGGLELALAADLRIASSTATFGLPETGLAIVPGAGGTQRLGRLIGIARAKELIWTGRRIQGEEAFEYGLVQKVVQPGQALEQAMELAWKIAGNGPVAIRASKEAIDRGMTASDMKEALEIERQCYARVLPTNDRLEGLAAFKEGRNPNYTGE